MEITFHYQQAFSLVKRVNIHRLAVSVLEELYQCVVACGLIDQEKRWVGGRGEGVREGGREGGREREQN